MSHGPETGLEGCSRRRRVYGTGGVGGHWLLLGTARCCSVLLAGPGGDGRSVLRCVARDKRV